jgi:hypothetical protein
MPRLIGKNLALFDIESTHYLATIRNCQINLTYETQENRALKDTARYVVPVVQDWSIEFTTATDGTVDATLMGLVGTSVDFSVDSGGSAYSGTGLLNQAKHSIPDGLQEVSFVIEPQGALTLA